MSDATTPPRLAPVRLFLGMALGLCLVVAMVTYQFRDRSDASWARIHADFAEVDAALEKYRAEHGSLPPGDSLEFLVPRYLPAVPVDPWGRPYIFLNNGKQPLLVTFGHDDQRGGSGEEQDHSQYDGHAR